MSDDDYYSIGTPIEIEEDESVPKPTKISDQVARDKQGRQRFHGAFTGGFSAGYFNSVGSKEGWTPSTFKSSRISRDATATAYKPEDFMDEEDFADHGIAPKKLTTKDDFNNHEEELASRKRQIKRAVDDGELHSAVPGGLLLDELIQPAKVSVGIQLLQKMGWKPGQGIGEKVDVKIETIQQPAATEKKKVYGCMLPPTKSNETSMDMQTLTSQLAPKDVQTVNFTRKDNVHGLGYSGINPETAMHGGIRAREQVFRPTGKEKRGIHGQAFGVGAFEEEDEDIYAVDKMSNYDISMTKESQSKYGWSGVPKNNKNKDCLPGFAKSSANRISIHKPAKLFAIPADFKPVHVFPSEQELARDVEKMQLTWKARSKLLGEYIRNRWSGRWDEKGVKTSQDGKNKVENETSNSDDTKKEVAKDAKQEGSEKLSNKETVNKTETPSVKSKSRWDTSSNAKASDSVNEPAKISIERLVGNVRRFDYSDAEKVQAMEKEKAEELEKARSEAQKLARQQREKEVAGVLSSLNQKFTQSSDTEPSETATDKFSEANERFKSRFSQQSFKPATETSDAPSLYDDKGSFKPFAKFPEKQKRYEGFLAAQKSGKKPDLVYDNSVTEWECERELAEFARSAILYRPLSSAIANRFTMATSSEEEKVSENLADDAKAAKMGMFGKLTRNVVEWRPEVLLCKRFNVADPYPQFRTKGIPSRKKKKHAFFTESFTEDGLMIENKKEEEEEQEESVFPIKPANEIPSKKTMKIGPLSHLNNLQGASEVASILKPQPASMEAPLPKPSIDIFKAIFDSSSSGDDGSSDEQDESNKPCGDIPTDDTPIDNPMKIIDASGEYKNIDDELIGNDGKGNDKSDKRNDNSGKRNDIEMDLESSYSATSDVVSRSRSKYSEHESTSKEFERHERGIDPIDDRTKRDLYKQRSRKDIREKDDTRERCHDNYRDDDDDRCSLHREDSKIRLEKDEERRRSRSPLRCDKPSKSSRHDDKKELSSDDSWVEEEKTSRKKSKKKKKKHKKKHKHSDRKKRRDGNTTSDDEDNPMSVVPTNKELFDKLKLIANLTKKRASAADFM